MRGQQERTMRDLYDRTRHKDLPVPEESAEGCGGGHREGSEQRELASKMEDKTLVRKRVVRSNNTCVKAESGTCNVCSAPCSSCLHPRIRVEDSNVECASSQTCSTRSEVKNNSLVRSEKGLCSKGENDDEFSATSGHVSYSATGGNKVVARSSIADDSSEVDMPSKRRRLLNKDTRLSRAEYLDDSNSCVTGISGEGKLHVDKKKLSTSASSRDLTAKDYKAMANHSKLRNQCVDKSKKGSDGHDMQPSSSGRISPVDSSVMTKKLLRTQSSVSTLSKLSANRQAHEFGKALDKLSHEPCEKTSLLKNNEQPRGGQLNPCTGSDNNHGTLAGCSHANKDGFSLKDLDIGTLCSKDEIQEHGDIHSNDLVKKNVGGQQDSDQDCSMDISSDKNLNIQHDVMTDCGNSEGLIDVNVCDICGDVGREYLLATCTRCLEGAEHTYCMRVKLEKVPVGEWFCEECQLKEDQKNTRGYYGTMAVNVTEGKNQRTESQSKPKALQIVVPDLDSPQVTHSALTADRCDGKSKRLHLDSADTQTRQVKDTTPATERLDVKNKKSLSVANRNKLQVLTSDLDTRPRSYGTPTSGVYNKSQSSEFLLNRKKLRVSTDMESPLSSEGLRSPPMSCKRHAESTSSPKPRLFKTGSLGKQDVISRENSFKKSIKGGLTSVDNVPVRTTQVVKSSQTLSRSYSLGNMVNAKAPVPSPRGLLSKQLSFNSNNNGPKVKQLVDGMSSKLRPAEHSPRDPRDKEPVKKIVRSGSLKREGSDSVDAGSSKQKQTFHLSQDEKPGILKPIKEKNLTERRASFSLKEPNIPSSPRPDSCMKSGERKIDQDISRSGTSILKSSKRPGYAEKQQSYDLSKSDNGKQDVTMHPKPMEVSGKDAYGVKISDPPVRSQCAKKDRSNDVEDEDLLISVNNVNIVPNEHAEVVSTTFTAMICESDLQDVPRESTSDGSAPKVVCCQQKLLENTGDDSCKIVEVVQDSGDMSVTPRGLQMAHNLHPPDNKLDKLDLKKEAFADQSSALGNPLKDFVIPEQSYIWQGSFEVSGHGNSPEMFDGFQAYLSTCASSKVREVGEQLPDKIQLAEVPRHSSWPLQFNEVNPTEDNIALFFFAKDVESYEKAYGKLLDNMLLGDLSLKANIGGTELLIFPSDKLPERIQRWNGLLFFWGIFYARKESSPLELPTNNCPLEQINGPVIQHDMGSPKALQPLGIDLNECPNDDISDPALSLGSESEKSGASVDHNILLEPKHEDRNLNASEIHHEETAGTRQIILGHPSAAPYGTNLPTISTGEGHDMVRNYPAAAIGSTGTAGGNKMEKADENETLFCFSQQPGAIRPISHEIKLQKHGLLPSHCHFSGSKICDNQTKSTPSSDMGSLDSDLTNKRQKTSYGEHSTCIFGDEMPPIKCLSKIHPLPAGQDNPFDVLQHCHRGPSDPVSLKKPVPDHIIHVLSSDDEDSPEPSTSLNKASLKADEGSSALLSLSLSMVATKHNLSGSDIVDDEPLSLSLGLPSIVDGSVDQEMKQFLPEKPGINT